MGENVFRKAQYGKELKTAKGTAVAATRLFTGTISVPPDRKPTFAELTTGRRGRAQKGHVDQIFVDGATLSMEHGVFQMLPFLFSIGLKGDITATEATSAQGDYVWDFTPILTGSNTPDAATIEYGDDTQAYRMEYCMARRYKISGTLGENAPVTVEAEIFGKQITGNAFTGSIAVPTVNIMSANMAKLYIDSTWATLGTTQKTGLLAGYSLEILTGVHAKFLAEGVKTFTLHGESTIDAILTLTLEGTSVADGYWDDFRAGTARAIRLEIDGEQIGSGTKHNLTCDLFGEFEEVIPLGSEKNGNNLHTAIFHGLDDNQATPHLLGVKVTTDRSTI